MNGPILIVDDEPINLDAMRSVLAGEHRLVYARNGREALAAAVKHRTSLILMDVDMPDMDGYTACRALKANPATEHIPVIFVTSHDDARDEALGFAAGAVDFIAKPISAPVVLARVSIHLSLVRATQLEQSYRDAIGMLGDAGHFNDTDTGMHIWRMAAYSRALAESLGWSAERCETLELAAPMHDTGKVGIPDAILRKPGKLDAGEWSVMRTHAQIGHDILARSRAPVFQLAAEVALCHHEKWDGSGYPHGLSRDEIPESARIVALADVFDALSMKPPYKDAWPMDKVMSTLRESSGTHFEPRLIEAFEDVLSDILDIKAQWDDRDCRGIAHLEQV